MKKIVSLLLAALMVATMCFGLASCNTPEAGGETGDWAKIQERGYFYCGITLYKPMNYYNEDDVLVGFDTEFAQAVAEELGVEAKFVTITWGSKYLELNSGAIDFIWNGYTFGDESDGTPRSNYVDFTYAYLNNSQCIVTTKEALATLTTEESFAGLRGAAEGGSAGEAVAKELAGENGTYTPVAAQTNALMELKAGTIDFAVIDVLMAEAMVGQGDFTDLAINNAYTPEPEVYAIGCRKGSDMTSKINEAILKLVENGKLAEIAAKYELSDALIQNIGEN